MKKFLTVLFAAAIILCGAVLLKGGFAVSAKVSPTAPTITDPSHVTVTIPPDNTTNHTSPVIPPSNPVTGTTLPVITGTTSGSTTRPGTTTPGVTLSTGTTGTTARTTPDGSTITGTVRPDQNPDSPKTGDTSVAVFVFAGLALSGATAAIVLKKNKEND